LLKFGPDKASAAKDIGHRGGRNSGSQSHIVDGWAAMLARPRASFLHFGEKWLINEGLAIIKKKAIKACFKIF
jgi:hypothetical protein